MSILTDKLRGLINQDVDAGFGRPVKLMVETEDLAQVLDLAEHAERFQTETVPFLADGVEIGRIRSDAVMRMAVDGQHPFSLGFSQQKPAGEREANEKHP